MADSGTLNGIQTTKKYFVLLFATVLFFVGVLRAEEAAPAPRLVIEPGTRKTLPPGRLDMVYSLDVPTPHTPWGRPYSRGPIQVWILSPIVPNGDTVGLLQRFDFNYDIVSCDASWEMNTWGMGDAYYKRSKKQQNGRALELKYATEDLTSDKRYDVMILPAVIGWNTYPEEMRKAIVRRVEEGAGLVLITPQDCKEKPDKPESLKLVPLAPDDIALPRLSPIGGASQIIYHWYGDWDRNPGQQPPATWKVKPGQAQHPIVRGLCWEEMPFATAVSTQDFKTVAEGATVIAEANGTPTLAVRQVGKGRVVAINWGCGRHGAALTPVEDESKCPTWDYWEQVYNLLGRACLWAAGQEPEVNITFGKYADGKLVMETDNGAERLFCGFRIIVKDERGRVLDDHTVEAAVGSRVVQHEVKLKDLPGGTNHVEVMVLDGLGRHCGWGATQIVVPKLAEITALTVSPEAVKNGEEITGEVILKGQGEGKVLIELRDPYDRVLARQEEAAKLTGAGTTGGAEIKVPYRFKVDNVISLVVFVRAQATLGGKVVSEKDSSEVVVTPSEPKFADYEVIPWGFSARRDLWAVKAEQYRKFNATANSAASPQAARAGFITKGHAEPEVYTLGVYWYADERQRLLKTWDAFKKSSDKSTLTRLVCLSDPQTLKNVEDTVRKKVAAQRKYNPGTYYIGDESSVTSYALEMELDFCPKALDDFRNWCKERYGAIEKLNAKWQTEFKDFAEIMPFVIQEVTKDPKKAVGWSEHRTFMEERYERVLEVIRKAGKEEDPNAEFELTGTQSATSFNGIDWARHTRHVKRFVPYNINFAYDQLRCFNPGVRMAALTGYGSSGPGVKLSLWNQALHGLLSANIFWEWSLVNADLTLSKDAVDIGEVFGELRGKGIGRLIGTTTWVASPVAIYYSQPSIHAARIEERESVCHNCRNAWCQAVRDLGLQFDMLSYRQVEDGRWLERPPKVLVLPAALAVSPREAAHLIQYVENGGTVVADIDPGLCDDRCDFRENKLLEKLFGDGKKALTQSVGKGQAVLLGEDIAGYGKKRGDKIGVEIRERVSKLLAGAGAAPTVAVTVDGQPLARAETVVMENGPWKLLGILKENQTGLRRTTPDGVEYFDPVPEGQRIPSEKIKATLPSAYHIYDVRTGKYHGQTAVIEDELAVAETKLYSLLPYQVKALKLTTADQWAPGANIHIAAELEIARREREQAQALPVGQHVFNVRVFAAAPAGAAARELRYYARNLPADQGRVSFVLPVELNATSRFKVVVTDVASGVSGVLEVK